ncbi:hypothetical protein AG1IA_08826 [Rhizoctonia solani AG-1 IA]|uniref:Deacetylase sirtuin-type domain-containing protein n=1 Tax=Thanatephorus cucumeris (strain AG1-IA) TaxID=983506 RepID=L8WLB7_THACA|nr:hypothetical protein AG1IA_08826 [Rhizoctonia solani AG-1 IA]
MKWQNLISIKIPKDNCKQVWIAGYFQLSWGLLASRTDKVGGKEVWGIKFDLQLGKLKCVVCNYNGVFTGHGPKVKPVLFWGTGKRVWYLIAKGGVTSSTVLVADKSWTFCDLTGACSESRDDRFMPCRLASDLLHRLASYTPSVAVTRAGLGCPPTSQTRGLGLVADTDEQAEDKCVSACKSVSVVLSVQQEVRIGYTEQQAPHHTPLEAVKSPGQGLAGIVVLALISCLMAPSSDVLAFREVLRTSRSLVILAGAGLSAASGTRSNSFKIRLDVLKRDLPITIRPSNVPWGWGIMEDICESEDLRMNEKQLKFRTLLIESH